MSWENATNATSASYFCGEPRLIFPLFDESRWGVPVRAGAYLLALLYFFLGVSIAADAFMCSIEKITSQTKIVKVKASDPEASYADGDNHEQNEGEMVVREVAVWNPTVANLTLMALGSSAPEILLSLIEIVGNTFLAGKLGPSTIVGSAAFNLLVITAVCIVSIPQTEMRRIADIGVFFVTAGFSVVAYLWLFFVLRVTSAGVVEMWEAVATLLLFVVLIVLAYATDRGLLGGCVDRAHFKKLLHGAKAAHDSPVTALTPTPPELKKTDDAAAAASSNGKHLEEHLSQSSVELRNRKHGATNPRGFYYLKLEKEIAKANPGASATTIASLTAVKIMSTMHHSRNYYRIMANRWIFGSATYEPQPPVQQQTKVTPSSAVSGRSSAPPRSSAEAHRPKSTQSSLFNMDAAKMSVVEFAAVKYAVSEAESHIRLKIIRIGKTNKRVLFKYETIDGTAKQDVDYVNQAETLVFNPSETEKTIAVQIIANDRKHDADESFYVKLGLEDFADGRTIIGAHNVATINIVDPKEDRQSECKLQFLHTAIVVKENCGTVQIPVIRKGNTKIRSSVGFCTVEGSAKDGHDYVGGVARLEFDQGEMEKSIYVDILDDKEFEKHETFEVQLTDAAGDGAAVSSKRKTCLITILNDDDTTLLLTHTDRLVPLRLDAMRPGSQTWRQQFQAAANVNGGHLEGASALDYVLHVLTFFWKLLFALVPPPWIAGGWLTFVVALALIGALTAVIGDLATIFGCLVGLHDSVTAITIVALGTSLPDLFASRWSD